jgi:hypothetical protein
MHVAPRRAHRRVGVTRSAWAQDALGAEQVLEQSAMLMRFAYYALSRSAGRLAQQSMSRDWRLRPRMRSSSCFVDTSVSNDQMESFH